MRRFVRIKGSPDSFGNLIVYTQDELEAWMAFLSPDDCEVIGELIAGRHQFVVLPDTLCVLVETPPDD